MSFRRDFISKPIFPWARGVLPAMSDAEREALEVDDFAPEALSPIYKKPADVHQFFQGLGEQRAAS